MQASRTLTSLSAFAYALKSLDFPFKFYSNPFYIYLINVRKLFFPLCNNATYDKTLFIHYMCNTYCRIDNKATVNLEQSFSKFNFTVCVCDPKLVLWESHIRSHLQS